RDCGGACRDLQTDNAHCGACGNACPPGNTCAAGACAVSCGAGLDQCGATCVNRQTDNAHCGACGTRCAAGQVCSGGVCGATCAAPAITCGPTDARFCANTSIDPANCGACGTSCALANTQTQGCTGGECAVVRCAAGFGDCDGAAANGCEVTLASSAAHCGGCGRACLLAHATPTCTAGACAVMACDAGFADCDRVASNGCEVNTRADNANCGTCGMGCAAGQVCSGGVCGATCAAPLATCGTAPMAFCANTAIDPTNCGVCGTVCALANVAAHGCAGGMCTPSRCAAGFGDCDGTAANGCETDLGTSAASCGACGRTCALPNATATCAVGACAVMACATGFADCDMNPANGCEVDTRTDNAHCGSCVTTCATGTMCTGGTCGTSCQAAQTNCSGTCATLASDPRHCGSCLTVCPTVANATTYCAAGGCGFACAAGFGDCDGVTGNGCEAAVTDVNNCRGCRVVCAPPANATALCGVAGCDFACNAGFIRSGASCVLPPRPIAPLSTATVTSRQPRLRWVLSSGDGAHVDLCRDRALTTGCVAFDAAGVSGAPATNLAAGVWFWRLTMRQGGVTTAVTGPTWQFTVGVRTAEVGGVPGPNISSGTTLDVNGDGYSDVVVGGYHSSTAYVYLGGAGTSLGATPITLTQPAGSSDFGISVASAGDVNGDGYSDLAVGASSSTGGGRAYVYLGGASGLATTPATALTGRDGASGEFGTVVASAGDVNGDGYADLAVSATGANSNAGAVYVYLGGATGLATTPASSMPGPDGASGRFGRGLASAGDVNGDGYADLVAAAPYANSFTGAVYLSLGSASGLLPALSIPPPSGTGRYGESVASAGDVNGDGYSDLAVGAMGANGGRGAAYVYLGSSTSLSTTPLTPTGPVGANLYNFGTTLTGAGDVNGDGYADLAVGNYSASSNAGAVYLFLGAAGPTPLSAIAATLNGPPPRNNTSSQFAYSLAGAGDIDGDGYTDIIVGTFGHDSAHVYFGALGATPLRATSIELSAPVGSRYFGFSVASAVHVERLRRVLWCAAPTPRRPEPFTRRAG
ncbi:MAG: FG-GAP-like repeat-containing protein, partial [Deltaproteobacteria bacterium]|nr:FG-GAP-like repeat-containing protein [Deltaproteobacteria bacterium]